MNKNPEIPDGYLRVTQVLQPFSKLSKIDPVVLNKAADRGTRVHKFCELHAMNLFLDEVDEDCKNYVDAFKKWFDVFVDQVVMIEERINSSKYKLSGAVDLIVTLKDSPAETVIVDIKTPETGSDSWRLQTAAYKMLVEEELSIKIHRRCCLMLPKKTQSVKILEYTNHELDQKLYLNALELYRFFN